MRASVNRRSSTYAGGFCAARRSRPSTSATRGGINDAFASARRGARDLRRARAYLPAERALEPAKHVQPAGGVEIYVAHLDCRHREPAAAKETLQAIRRVQLHVR